MIFEKKNIMAGILVLGVATGSMGIGIAANAQYFVHRNDTFWILGQKYGISIEKLMKANNATANTVLYEGQSLVFPISNIYMVKSGETYWTISKKFGIDFMKLLAANDANESSNLQIGENIILPDKAISAAPVATSTPVATPTPTPVPTSVKPYITYTYYTVLKNDNVWGIAEKLGIPEQELLQANNITEATVLNVNSVLKVPVHNIPIKSTPGEKFGELLDWWSEAQYVVKKQIAFEVMDFYTGKSFFAKRTTGSNHADCEPATYLDTQKMKEIWGGYFSWERRPVIVKISGRSIAASVTAMPHAGIDTVAGGIWTAIRSGGYGAGYNLDWVKNNGADGVFDIHFLNSTRHKDGQIDLQHQVAIKIAAGLK
jgi:LysM repeat protein